MWKLLSDLDSSTLETVLKVYLAGGMRRMAFEVFTKLLQMDPKLSPSLVHLVFSNPPPMYVGVSSGAEGLKAAEGMKELKQLKDRRGMGVFL